MTYFWISLMVMAILIDISSSGFIFFVFSIGALAAMLCNMANLSIIMQIIVFASVSIISMFSIVPYIKKKIAKSSMEFIPQENRLIGRTIVLQEDLNSTLLVNIDGVFWTIKTLSGDIPSGTKVKIVSMEGNKYIVEKV